MEEVMGKYFTIEELCESDYAVINDIDNTPDEEQIGHLNELIELLDKIRESWGSAIRVNSGFRSKQLNKALNGSKTSAHTEGYAADITPSNGLKRAFMEFIDEEIDKYNFDQLIFEKPKNGIPSWFHIGLKNRSGLQRKQKFTLI